MSAAAQPILIRGGTVVDGTSAPAFRADVRVRWGVIREIAPNLAPRAGERVVDASGCSVAPGFIESHAHLDGSMWWQLDLEPLPGNGFTTAVMGNCGFPLAPVHPDPAVRAEVVTLGRFPLPSPRGIDREGLKLS